MSENERAKRDESRVSPPVVDLLKRHTTLPSRSLIQSEALELARRMKSRGDSPSETTSASKPGST